MKTTRLCVLCDTIIDNTHIVCAEHIEDYTKYKDDEWFKEIAMLQRRQFEIDLEELKLSSKNQKITKLYKKLSESEKKAILFLRSKELSYGAISKVLGIHRDTIYKFVKRYYTNNR